MIRNSSELQILMDRVYAGHVAALDTEFVWRRSYRPKLALIQMASADGVSDALDCLTGVDPSPLGTLLADASVVKILHDARQDLDHLFHYTGMTPVSVFDTQLAAAFSDLPARLSLQKLIQETVGVSLPKTETVSDWCQRPLTEAQIKYALDDVHYLPEVRAILTERMTKAGTRAWFEEESLKYDDPSFYGDSASDTMWRRIKCGNVRLDASGYGRLRALAAIREEKAVEWNLPRTWLSDDPSLVDLAAGDVRAASDIRFRHRLQNRGMREILSGLYAMALHAAVVFTDDEMALALPPNWLPEVRAAADDALVWLREHGTELHVDSALIANRATVMAWVDNPDDGTNPLASGWRYEVAGREIAERFAVPL